MSGSAIADRLRDYIRERRASVSHTLTSGACENMEDYHAGCARLKTLEEIETEIGEIMKDINGGV